MGWLFPLDVNDLVEKAPAKNALYGVIMQQMPHKLN
jgi:hypothetical protein